MGRSSVRLVVLGTVAVAVAATGPAAVASVMLHWRAGPRLRSASITGLACPSRALCVAVDSTGHLFVSSRPSSRTAVWRRQTVGAGGQLSLSGIACPTIRLCVAIDDIGDVVSSTHPATGRSWVVSHVDGSPNYNGSTDRFSPVLTGISCPSRSLCVVVDWDGNAVTSTSPGGGIAAWAVHQIDDGLDYECYHYGGTGPACVPGLVAVSCALTTSCTAIDWAGGVLSTTNPIGTGLWGGGQQPASESYDGVACPTTSTCLLTQLHLGQIFFGSPPRPVATLEPSGYLTGIWCRSTRMCFAAGVPSNSGSPTVRTQLFESTSPTSARPAWKRVYTARSIVSAVSCPSTGRCLATEAKGQILIGTPPTVQHR